MPAYAAVATDNGYQFFGGEPEMGSVKKSTSKKQYEETGVNARHCIQSSIFRESASETEFAKYHTFTKTVDRFGERVKKLVLCRSHGKHGRKRMKARHLPR
ncbi:MAG: hypothetical protein M0P64_04110 [Candidatus Pacebacteria bacterium]|jgi:hypothetical protein|nr:hypothetical protein [Candidatus Paceibacterota bacterium]